MDSLNLVTSLRNLIGDQLSEIHTSVPARVTGVDYDTKTVTLESIVKNTRGVDDEIPYPTFYDVPISMMGGGTGRITFPIKSGDLGVLMFSERDPSNALQTDGTSSSSATLIQPCGLYPIAFIPKIAMGDDSTESIDSSNIVISNNKSTYVTLSPDGTINLKNAGGKWIMLTTDDITMSDGTGTLTLSNGKLDWTGGEVTINGLTIDVNGKLTDATGVELDSHTHWVRGVESGDLTVESEAPLSGD